MNAYVIMGELLCAYGCLQMGRGLEKVKKIAT